MPVLPGVIQGVRRIPTSAKAAVVFFAIALVASTFFLGDIGVYNDDWFCNQRDPVTHEAHDFVMNRPWHLWRPLTRVVLIPLVTALWEHPWALHAISAALHGMVVWLFYLLLRRAGVRAGVAGVVALAFMLYPAHFEAVLWIDIICTLMAVALVLGIWNVYAWWLVRSHEIGGRTRFAVLLALGVAAWCAAAFNEQPPGALLAMALLPLVIGWAAGRTRMSGAARSMMPVAAVSVGLLVYLRGYFKHTRGAHAGHQEAVAEAVTENLTALATKIPREMWLKNVAQGALEQGVEAARMHPVWACVLLVGMVWMGMVWAQTRRERADEGTSGLGRLFWLVPLGAVWFVGAWLPVAAAHAVTTPRLHYVPALGLGLMIAPVLCVLAAGVDRLAAGVRGCVVWIGRAGVMGLVVCAVLMWIGFQSNYQKRFEADKAEIEPLARLLGPAVPPGTIFIPTKVTSPTSITTSPRYDVHFAHCWTWEFAAGWRLQYELRRKDVYTVVTARGTWADGLFMDDSDETGTVMMKMRIAAPLPPHSNSVAPKVSGMESYRRVALGRCVFFAITERGKTEIFTKVRLNPLEGEPVVIPCKALEGTPAAVLLPERVLDLHPMPAKRREKELEQLKQKESQ